MKELQKEAAEYTTTRIDVVIIGAGPAGLVRAVQSLVLGNRTIVIEKRPKGDLGRENAVQIGKDAITDLKEFGVIDYLVENNLINTPNDDSLIVRLGDLETAFKAVISHLTDESIIRYDSCVEKVDAAGRLIIRTGNGICNSYNKIELDLLVICDGARSPTSQRLFSEERVEILPKVPVVAAVFRDRTYSLRHPIGAAKNAVMAVQDDLRHAYYTGLFLCKTLFQCEHVFNKKRQIAGSIILPTPGQNYLGFSLNAKESEVLRNQNQRVQELQQQLRVAEQDGNAETIAIQKRQLKKSQGVLQSTLRHWSHLAFCQANSLALIQRIWRTKTKFPWSYWKPLDLEKTTVFEIGADKAKDYAGMIGKIPYVKGGDALATTDPVTGLGCTTAIDTVVSFKKLLVGMKMEKPLEALLHDYDKAMTSVVVYMHSCSKNARKLYRPPDISE